MKHFKQIDKVVNFDRLRELLNPTINLEFHRKIGIEAYSFKGRTLNGKVVYGQESMAGLFDDIEAWNIWKPGWESGELLKFIPQFDPKKISRVRISNLLPYSCYSWHKDSTLRIHIPIYTNKSCRMVIQDEITHLTEGNIWLVNTRNNMHTAFNGNRDEDFRRIHLMYDYHGDWNDVN